MAAPSTAPAWRRAFLRELARSGSVALAADKAGIDRTSAYQVRRRNAAFAASWERAVEAARANLGEAAFAVGDDPRPQGLRPSFASPQGGAVTGADPAPSARNPLRLRGDECVRASKTGQPCIVRAGAGRWCADVEQRFLDELAASANVKAAARAAGVSAVTAYNRRRQSPAFAAAWDAARADGWLRLELLLIQTASATLDPEPAAAVAPEDRAEAPAMSVEQAMQLWFHRPGARPSTGSGRGHAWRRQEPDIEDVRAEILRKVAAIEKARGEKAGGEG